MSEFKFVTCFNTWYAANGWQLQLDTTSIIFGNRVPFLDVEVYKNHRNEWHTTLYFKDTDVHAYLSPSTHHPPHIVTNIPIGVAIRLRRICSEWFEWCKVRELFDKVFFARRGYCPNLVSKAFGRIGARPRASLLQKRPPKTRQESFVSFVFQYGEDVDLAATLMAASKSTKAASPHHPLPFNLPQRPVYKVAPNIKKRLMKARFHRGPAQQHGFRKCNEPGCALCPFVIGDSYIASFEHGTCHRIRGSLNCLSKDVIYVVTCHRCGCQGVGECKEPRARLHTYIAAASKNEPGSENYAIHRHFMDSDHSPDDLSITFVDALPRTISCRPAIITGLRKRWEWRWTHRLDAKLNVCRNLPYSFAYKEGDEDEL